MRAVVSPMKKAKDHEYDAEVREFRKREKNKRLSRSAGRNSKRVGEGEIDECV